MDLAKYNAGEVVKAKAAEVKQFEQFAAVYTCSGDEDEAAGHEALGAVKSLLNAADLERKKLVEPLKKVTSEVDAMFRDQITRPLETVKARVENSLRIYAAEQLRKQREKEAEERRKLDQAQAEQRRIEREAAEAERAGAAVEETKLAQAHEKVVQAATAVVEVSRPVVVATGNAVGGYKTKWTATITDPSKVPDVYWRPDLALIQRAVDDGAREIPGVQITEEVMVANRRK